MRESLEGVDLADVCITSDIAVLNEEGPPEAVARVRAISVIVDKAPGTKCARSWRFSPLVGSDPEFPEVTPRDAEALRELKAAGRLA